MLRHKFFFTRSIILIIMILLIFSLVACSNSQTDQNQANNNLNLNPSPSLGDDQGDKQAIDEDNSNTNTEEDNNDNDNDQTNQDNKTLTDSELSELKVNELGDIMILMYHQITDKEDEWERSADNFRNDLQTLYDEGYYLVNARDFATDNMQVPAGKTPVVLTFDDGTEGHFRLIEDASGNLIPDPDCAVGIIENFAKDHPDFGLAATFYVFYPVPFGQVNNPDYRTYKYEYLEKIGMEIGNHAYNHEFLNKLSDADAQKAIALNVIHTQKILADYNVNTMALTYGIYPTNPNFAVTGTYDGLTYYNDAVFLVGANPTPSSYSINYNPAGVPRIRAASVPEDYFNMWLDHFRTNPERRYISDGDINTITVPEDYLDKISPDYLENKNIRTY